MSTADRPEDDSPAAHLMRLVALGTLDQVRDALTASPTLVNAVGPHPFWGGRPQPLHVAIENGRAEIVEALLEAGADVDGRNDQYDHWSPLMLAITGRQPVLRDALLARGARVGLVETLLLGDDVQTQAMLAGGASSLPADVPNQGSLMAFARTTDAIDRLLALGVSAEAPDRWGSTPMDAMSRLGERGAALVAHLAGKGIPVAPVVHARLGDQSAVERQWQRDAARTTSDAVLLAAVDGKHHALVSWLLAHGASVDARTPPPSRHTASHAAAWNGDLAMVTLLADAGANLTTRDEEHHGTPLDWANAAVDITRNAACRDVARYLETRAGGSPGSA